jgi:molybdenum cofactor synthesis domain-containing protein
LASVGYEQVVVVRRPRVGVFSTGDELVTGPAPLQPGQIRDSNRPTLLALVAESGCIPIDLGSLPDNEELIEAALRKAVGPDADDPCDALVTSGGVSMGDFDFVKRVLARLGDLNWMQVAIKPAKPLAFGLLMDTPIFGLPGNPVSSMVSFELFARPALLKMMGRKQTERTAIWAVSDDGMSRHSDGKTHFMRVVVDQDSEGAWKARSAGGQGSHQLTAMARANGLAVVPDGDGIEPGGRVRVMLLD